MKTERLAMVVTGINLVLLAVLLGQSMRPAVAEEPAATGGALPVLRGSKLEIVDDQGRVRALLAVMPPATVDGKDYPETVLLRLIDPKNGPVVKLTAAVDGSALGLSDDAEGGVRIFARDDGSFVSVVGKDGTERRVD